MNESAYNFVDLASRFKIGQLLQIDNLCSHVVWRVEKLIWRFTQFIKVSNCLWYARRSVVMQKMCKIEMFDTIITLTSCRI